jgi:hypothetical protein
MLESLGPSRATHLEAKIPGRSLAASIVQAWIWIWIWMRIAVKGGFSRTIISHHFWTDDEGCDSRDPSSFPLQASSLLRDELLMVGNYSTGHGVRTW